MGVMELSSCYGDLDLGAAVHMFGGNLVEIQI